MNLDLLAREVASELTMGASREEVVATLRAGLTVAHGRGYDDGVYDMLLYVTGRSDRNPVEVGAR